MKNSEDTFLFLSATYTLLDDVTPSITWFLLWLWKIRLCTSLAFCNFLHYKVTQTGGINCSFLGKKSVDMYEEKVLSFTFSILISCFGSFILSWFHGGKACVNYTPIINPRPRKKPQNQLRTKDSCPLFTLIASRERKESKMYQLCQSITNKFTSLSIHI